MDEATKEKFDCWCVLELFGHVRLAGRVTEASIGGCSFLRVDVPRADGEIEFTRYFGNGAIYSMTPVTEEVARAVGNGTSAAPVKPWELPKKQIAAGDAEDDYQGPAPRDDDDDDDDDGPRW